uniref:Mannosyltransferase n=1 Tax=Angiostrongylus cantonensis TaxID=6313 RepID=A0A158P9R9_ANGCA
MPNSSSALVIENLWSIIEELALRAVCRIVFDKQFIVFYVSLAMVTVRIGLNTYGVSVGIYTNFYDWQQITNNWTGATNCPLWYWKVLGPGPSGETSSNFYDFHPFSLWTSPIAKQFGQLELVCGSTVNRAGNAVLVMPMITSTVLVRSHFRLTKPPICLWSDNGTGLV